MQIPPNSVLGKSNLILETVSAAVSLDFAVFRKFGGEVQSFGMEIDDEEFAERSAEGVYQSSKVISKTVCRRAASLIVGSKRRARGAPATARGSRRRRKSGVLLAWNTADASVHTVPCKASASASLSGARQQKAEPRDERAAR